MRNASFFLGGRDLEMVTIAKLLARFPSAEVHDRGLAWGAKASAYDDVIRSALATGRNVVLVELIDDLSADIPRDRVHVVDHHGDRAARDAPTSLEQVFELVELPREEWSREFELVAANDRGHVAAMLRLAPPATREELQHIRAADRAVQGITAEQEEQGRRAAAEAELRFHGRLTLVRLSHNRTATVTDSLEPEFGGPGHENLLILSPAGVTFFGEGRAIDALRTRFAGGFYGGELPYRGFWGHSQSIPLDDLLSCLAFLGEPR